MAGMKALLVLLSALFLTASGEEIRVMTFNIRLNNASDGANAWDYRREAVAKLIKDRADIAGLQEVRPEQRSWLIEQMPEFGFIGVGRAADDTDESVPVVYRKDRFEVIASGTFWLSETPQVVASTSWGNKLPRVCTWAKLREKGAGKVMLFYNVHLDHQSGAAREKGLSLALDHIAAQEGKEPAVLVGDLNATVGDPPLEMLKAKEKPAMISTFESLAVPPAGTFHGFTGQTKTRAIDFIFVEKGRWKVVDGQILKTTYPANDGVDRHVSDHFPVEATLRFAP